MSTVLLVDDSPADRALFKTVLSRAGLTVHESSTGADGFMQARELRPHVIVLDVNLPDTDGYTLCRSFRADPQFSGIPVLILTGREGDNEILQGLQAGADDFLPKDSPKEIIQARVRRLANYRQMATVTQINEQLAQVGRLLAGIVHEIRGPLTVIRGNAELLRLNIVESDTTYQWVEPILRNTRLLQNRLEHLMAAVRGGPPSLQTIEPGMLVTEATEMFMKGIDPRRGKIEIVTEINPITPAIYADPGRIIQVLMNLLGNAHEAITSIANSGMIIARVDRLENGALIEIVDTGPGIPAVHLERIFEPFFTTKEGGSGYGLYLASEIVREHGGKLTATNREQGGVCFTIWLPDAATRVSNSSRIDAEGSDGTARWG